MFPRRRRILAAELKARRGRVAAESQYFMAKTAPNSAGYTKYAVIVGASVDRRSSRRHTLKRRASEVLQNYDLGPRNFALIVLKAANKLSAPEFRVDLHKLMQAVN